MHTNYAPRVIALPSCQQGWRPARDDGRRWREKRRGRRRMSTVAPAAKRAPTRSEERRWRRLVDRVRREDGKLFAHHRSLVEVAPVGGRRLAPACYVGGRRRSTVGLDEDVVDLDRKNGHPYRVAWPCTAREALGAPARTSPRLAPPHPGRGRPGPGDLT